MIELKENPRFQQAAWLLVILMVLAGVVLILRTYAADLSVTFKGQCSKISDYTKRELLGNSCLISPGKYKILLPDGSSLDTHGGDPRKAVEPHVDPDPVGLTPRCINTRNADYYHRLIYIDMEGYNQGRDQRIQEFRTEFLLMNRKLNDVAGDYAYKASFKVFCANNEIKIDVHSIPANQAFEYSNAVDMLKNKGYDSTREKYLIFWDTPTIEELTQYSGISSIRWDDSNSSSNKNNVGPSYSFAFILHTATLLHETTHAMGGVQESSPNSTGGGHCTDGLDILCYEDDGPNANEYDPNVCGRVPEEAYFSAESYDCNSNDYFHPSPSSGYLTNHWNVGSRLNRFLVITPG